LASAPPLIATNANAALAQTIAVHFCIMVFNPHVTQTRALKNVRFIYAFSCPAVLPMPKRREMGFRRNLRFLNWRYCETHDAEEVCR